MSLQDIVNDRELQEKVNDRELQEIVKIRLGLSWLMGQEAEETGWIESADNKTQGGARSNLDYCGGDRAILKQVLVTP